MDINAGMVIAMSSSENIKTYQDSDVDTVFARLIKEFDFASVHHIGCTQGCYTLTGHLDGDIYVELRVEHALVARHHRLHATFRRAIDEEKTISLLITLPFDNRIFDSLRQYLKVFKSLIVGEVLK